MQSVRMDQSHRSDEGLRVKVLVVYPDHTCSRFVGVGIIRVKLVRAIIEKPADATRDARTEAACVEVSHRRLALAVVNADDQTAHADISCL
jgi:hypothetical protein